MSATHAPHPVAPPAAEIPHLPAHASVGQVSAALDRVGAAVVDDLVPPALLDHLRADLVPALADTAPGAQSADPEWVEFHGRRTVRFGGLAARSDAFVDVLVHPLLVGVAEQALLPACGSIQCADTQAMAIGPGEVAQYLHRDQSTWGWFNRLGVDGPEVSISAMVAVTDFREENGATRIVPGSHRQADDEARFDQAATVPAEMDAGSVLLFSGRTVHGGGANRTDGWRVGAHLLYALGWLRPEEAHPFVIDDDRARALPAEARRLLGFTQYDPPPGDGGRLWLVDFEDPAPRWGGR